MHVETIGFDYGQRHRVELDQRGVVLRALRTNFRLGSAPRRLLALPTLAQISETSLTRETVEMTAAERCARPQPASRMRRQSPIDAIGAFVGGMCETDYSGYLDCR